MTAGNILEEKEAELHGDLSDEEDDDEEEEEEQLVSIAQLAHFLGDDDDEVRFGLQSRQVYLY